MFLIDAGPGTGKTFVLEQAYNRLTRRIAGNYTYTEEQADIIEHIIETYGKCRSICFFTHDNSSKENLKNRITGRFPIYTFCGAGASSVIKKFGYQKKIDSRTEGLIETCFGVTLEDLPYNEKKEWYAIKLVSKHLKIESLQPTQENLEYVMQKYPALAQVQLPDDWDIKLEVLHTKGLKPNGVYDYTDMLWMGAHHAKRRYDLGIVDEAQDVSRVAYELVIRTCGAVVWAGDRNQSINAFAGASEHMYTHIENKVDALLPLKVTQRCPKLICDLANQVRPGGIIHGPNQLESTIETLRYETFTDHLTTKSNPNNTLLLARTNATTFNLAIHLSRKNIPYYVIDKEGQVLSTLLSFIKQSKADTPNKLIKFCDSYIHGMEQHDQLWAVLLADKAKAIKEIANSHDTVEEVITYIKDAFKPKKKGFKIATCHKSKGLEASNIYIIAPPLRLHKAMEHPIGREQEINLEFVAFTRSCENLFWVK